MRNCPVMSKEFDERVFLPKVTQSSFFFSLKGVECDPQIPNKLKKSTNSNKKKSKYSNNIKDKKIRVELGHKYSPVYRSWS